MIDVHCHFDMAKNPQKYILDNERSKIITIGMTNLPSHFQMGINHVRRYKYIRLALGLHPLRAEEHNNEYSIFRRYIDETSYIGEVGLDFSREGLATKDIQIDSLAFVLDCVQGKKKILNIHSRQAEDKVLEMLIASKNENAIFHWYSGSLTTIRKIVKQGFFFSINSAMTLSQNGRKIIEAIPQELILTETDFPFIANSNIPIVHNYLSTLWEVSLIEVNNIIDSNFNRLLHKIR